MRRGVRVRAPGHRNGGRRGPGVRAFAAAGDSALARRRQRRRRPFGHRDPLARTRVTSTRKCTSQRMSPSNKWPIRYYRLGDGTTSQESRHRHCPSLARARRCGALRCMQSVHDRGRPVSRRAGGRASSRGRIERGWAERCRHRRGRHAARPSDALRELAVRTRHRELLPVQRQLHPLHAGWEVRRRGRGPMSEPSGLRIARAIRLRLLRLSEHQRFARSCGVRPAVHMRGSDRPLRSAPFFPVHRWTDVRGVHERPLSGWILPLRADERTSERSACPP